MEKSYKILQEMKNLGYNNVILNRKNKIFLEYLNEKNIDKTTLTEETLKSIWKSLFTQDLKYEQLRKKLKYFTSKKINIQIIYLNKLPAINTYFTKILILNSHKDSFQQEWSKFTDIIYKSSIAPSQLAKSDFNIQKDWTYDTVLEYISYMDESNKKESRQKKLYYLFFLYLNSQKIALLSANYIMPKDTFLSFTSSLKVLEFFHKKHFFTTMPHNKNLIEREMHFNNKAKYINYMRFSYLVNYNINLLGSIKDDYITRIMLNLRASSKSSKMVRVYENPIRKCLYWHGASNVKLTKRESDKKILSPLEILFELTDINPKYIDIFYAYFSSQPNNQEQRRNAKHIKKFLIFLHENISELTRDNLKRIFVTTVKQESKNSDIRLDSIFLKYLYENIEAKSTQQDIQMIVFQSIENHDEFAGCFSKSFLETIYKNPQSRRIARLALDKRILQKMKEICLLNPIPDNYYIPSDVNKENFLWEHFDKTEPQLPIMLFIYLSVPWRKEHIISMDRNNFLKKDAKNNIIEIQVTTDKNQNNDFYIEREYFEYAIQFTDSNGKTYDTLSIIDDMVKYSIESFPKLEALLRHDNETWGKITPILCRNSAIGFLPDGIFDGYYYKVFLQALYELKYPYEEIQYFIQLSKEGTKKLKDYSNIYPSLNKLSLHKANAYFNSDYFSPHSIRKTNITYLISAKKTFEFVLKLSGHRALSTVLKVYIDYEMLEQLNISSEHKTAITDNFRSSKILNATQIINNYRKYNSISIKNIKLKLHKEKLFFSPLTLSGNKTLKPNKYETLEILMPNFWEKTDTGICTNSFNCEEGRNNKCSLCPFFLTGINFIHDISAKTMQLSSKVTELFKIINKHLEDENLSGKEAVIYEEEAQLVLAEIEAYAAIIDKINESITNDLYENISAKERLYLPVKKDVAFIKYNHIPYLSAQLEIYQYAKENLSYNLEIEHSIEVLYTKIMELIVLGHIPADLFTENITDKEKLIDNFLNLLNTNDSIASIGKKYLLI